MNYCGRKFLVILICLGTVLAPQISNAQFWKKKKKKEVSKEKIEDTKKDAFKNYSKVITKEAETKEGVFKVHKVKNDYYFEIPLNILSREFLVVNKLSGVPENLNDAGINRGMNYQNKVITFELNKDLKKVFIREVKPYVECPKEDGIYLSVKENFRASILDYFKIQCFNKDTTAVVVKVNKYFNGSNKNLNNAFAALNIGSSAKTDLSKINIIKAFPKNIVVKSELTMGIPGSVNNPNVSILTTSNIVLLDKEPMKARFSDERIGYFSNRRWYFNDKQHKLEKRQLVNRWRLEPKEEDKEKYLKGELVEPKKQIVFYVDPGTPKQWVKYIKQGIEEWQVAFERAGFKNAIIAKDAPTNNPNFDPDDVRFSVVTYAASPKANAMGPSVIDPRSGEIIEADIIWWHNVMTSVHEWMRVQTGVIDPKSRKNTFAEEHMGDAIRFVSSHEVGHTLGLMHNMGASSAYPVDSLRSKTFTDKVGGTAPSIMDYARFNYVAQPGDGVKKITPIIGEYDKYAIGWAYRWLNTKTPHQELEVLNKWINKHAGDPIYRFGQQQDSRKAVDPSAQSEDVGDNSMKASRYGLKNLKVLVTKIDEWATEEGKSYEEAGKLYSAAINQWVTYTGHVITNVGGMYVNVNVKGDGLTTYTHVPRYKQRDAVKYLINNVFTAPKWLFELEIAKNVWPVKDTPIGPQQISPFAKLTAAQSFAYWDLLDNDRIVRMLENERINGFRAYKATDLMNDLYKGIFKNTIRNKKLDVYERASQKGLVDALLIAVNRGSIKIDKRRLHNHNHANSCSCSSHSNRMPMLCDYHKRYVSKTDNHIVGRNLIHAGAKRVGDDVSLKRGTLFKIKKLLKSRLKVKDDLTRYHYMDLISRIDKIINK